MSNDEKIVDDIWSGGKIKTGMDASDVKVYDPKILSMVSSYRYSNDDSLWIFKFIGMILGIGILIWFSVCGPAMLHNKLVVCNGGTCHEYTNWKVISENKKTGILEVYVNGHLQRLSNGTWSYR